MYLTDRSAEDLFNRVQNMFRVNAYKIEPTRWQGVDVSRKKEMTTYELLNFDCYLSLEKNEYLEYWRDQIKPNLPWADTHFEERVSGVPLNPGTEWESWPDAKSASKFLENGIFNHTYAERYWPKMAGRVGPLKMVKDFTKDMSTLAPHQGIRGKYGDLSDLINLLSGDPSTRQAVLPMFFPEDTGKIGTRKPCSLLYQFHVINNQLHIYYPMRSCDAIRHLRDDLYLTIRLAIWVLQRCRELNSSQWSIIRLGTLGFHATSLHIFENDFLPYCGVLPNGK